MLKKVVMVFGLALLTVACDPLDEYRNKSDTYLYDTGMDYLESGRHERAAKVFEEVDLQHPSSPLAPKALLMAGYCYYLESNPDSRNTNRFPDALDKFESFVRLHPNHEMIPYALYMMGMCHFEMLGDEMRDQTASAKAVGYFSNLIERFPNVKNSCTICRKKTCVYRRGVNARRSLCTSDFEIATSIKDGAR
jgi:outer membrane protein assembly factor BamD